MNPLIIERFADNGEHSHFELIDSNNGNLLWSEDVEPVSESMQIGASATADFQSKTWTFEMIDDFKVSSGLFVIIPKLQFEKLLKLLHRAGDLVGHPMANHSSSIDLACDNWRDEYDDFVS